MTMRDDRLENALKDIGNDHDPSPDWQQRVWQRVERNKQHSLWWIEAAVVIGVFVLSIAVGLAIFYLGG